MECVRAEENGIETGEQKQEEKKRYRRIQSDRKEEGKKEVCTALMRCCANGGPVFP